MDINKKMNMAFNGVGSIGSGKYNEVSINGVGKLNGDIEGTNISVNGTCTGSGNVKGKEISVDGYVNIKGSLQCEKLSAQGSLKLSKEVKGEILKVDGEVRSLGKIEFKRIEGMGGIITEGDCICDEIKTEGFIKVLGLLSADNIEIISDRKSRINKIGGENIRIKLARREKSFIKDMLKGKIECERIEGDTIFLEGVKGQIVNGKNITIGEDSIIEEVNYSESLEIENGGIVKNKNYIGEKING
ncbi:MAG: hypothetical protein ACRC28_01205 [Clostridium sp.]|uniref:hypothetical protein n=1 Tax=Clostridium sp. TaxID=1506 RepID=UPI003F36017C